MLKMTKNKLELISDPDMHVFFEKSTRGEILYIYNRYNEPNNKYLKPYDQKQESKDIIYLDANNFYSYTMSNFFSNKWIQMDRS